MFSRSICVVLPAPMPAFTIAVAVTTTSLISLMHGLLHSLEDVIDMQASCFAYVAPKNLCEFLNVIRSSLLDG